MIKPQKYLDCFLKLYCIFKFKVTMKQHGSKNIIVEILSGTMKEYFTIHLLHALIACS